MAVKFGPKSSQQLEDDTAGMLLEAMFKEAPGVFGYFLAVAVTGVAPSRPRSGHAAPDLQQPAGPRLVEGGRK